MKRTISIVLALVVGLMASAQTSGDWTAYKAASFSNIDVGAKTITITSSEELALFAYNVNNQTMDLNEVSFKDYAVTLGEDLDLSGHYWIPIGTYYTAETFTGTFNGAGHTISNLDLYVEGSVTGNVAGLFGQIGTGGTVKDVIIISGPYIGIKAPTAHCSIGGIAGINNGTIIGCANAAKVTGNYAGACVGGIAGENNGTIQNCYNLGIVYTSQADNHIGGIVGDNKGYVQNCFTRCQITVGETVTVYPLVGNNGGTIAGCFYANGSTYNPLTPEIRALSNNADNAAAISSAAAAGTGQNILLQDRTLFTDGGWNTLCLPFSIPAGAEGYSPIAGAQVKTLSSSSFSAGTLTLDFTDATTIEAGKPYIIKWNTTIASHLENPVFMNVTVSSATTDITSIYVDFIGSFSPVALTANDYTKLYLGGENTLYYPTESMTINSFRAYFTLKEIEVGTPSSPGIKGFVLNFDDDATGINRLTPDSSHDGGEKAGAWFDLSGRKINAPSTIHNPQLPRGIYIHNGKKIMIK